MKVSLLASLMIRAPGQKTTLCPREVPLFSVWFRKAPKRKGHPKFNHLSVPAIDCQRKNAGPKLSRLHPVARAQLRTGACPAVLADTFLLGQRLDRMSLGIQWPELLQGCGRRTQEVHLWPDMMLDNARGLSDWANYGTFAEDVFAGTPGPI